MLCSKQIIFACFIDHYLLIFIFKIIIITIETTMYLFQDFNVTKEGIKCLFLTYGLKENIYSAHAYNLFGLFWGLFFAVGIGQVSLSGAFATYYWTLDKRRIPTFAVAVAFCRCMR